uniref:Uncharacterized protein n=1 Tax=Anguilla anguilla TaxID=7936 RepID=A0A0E9T8Y1_ANGAN
MILLKFWYLGFLLNIPKHTHKRSRT